MQCCVHHSPKVDADKRDSLPVGITADALAKTMQQHFKGVSSEPAIMELCMYTWTVSCCISSCFVLPLDLALQTLTQRERERERERERRRRRSIPHFQPAVEKTVSLRGLPTGRSFLYAKALILM